MSSLKPLPKFGDGGAAPVQEVLPECYSACQSFSDSRYFSEVERGVKDVSSDLLVAILNAATSLLDAQSLAAVASFSTLLASGGAEPRRRIGFQPPTAR